MPNLSGHARMAGVFMSVTPCSTIFALNPEPVSGERSATSSNRQLLIVHKRQAGSPSASCFTSGVYPAARPRNGRS